MDIERNARSSRSQPAEFHDGMIRLATSYRTNGPQAAEPIDLGKSLKAQRTRRGWTLAMAADRTGLAQSTLSKIENNQMSPTFEVLQKLARGFEIDIASLFYSEQSKFATGRRSITRNGTGRRHETPTHHHELLNADLANKQMLPFRCVIKARSLDAFDGWMRHQGEEFTYVIKGRIRVYTEHYEPVDLRQGDSIYLDGTMGHALISTGPTDAVVLSIVTD